MYSIYMDIDEDGVMLAVRFYLLLRMTRECASEIIVKSEKLDQAVQSWCLQQSYIDPDASLLL